MKGVAHVGVGVERGLARTRSIAAVRATAVPGLAALAALLVMSGCRSAEPSSSSPPPSAAGATTSGKPPTATETRELVLHVEGLTCEGCAWQIRETLQKVDGITDVRTTVADKRVVVTYDPSRANSQTATRALDRVGYSSEEVGASSAAATDSSNSSNLPPAP